MVNKPTTTSKSLTKHLSIKKLLIEEFFINATVEYIYFSHHNAARILIKKKMLLIFILFHKIQYYQAILWFYWRDEFIWVSFRIYSRDI